MANQHPRGQPPSTDRAQELLAMVAHELRRPLTAVLGALATAAASTTSEVSWTPSGSCSPRWMPTSAQAILEARLGPDHPEAASNLDNLAIALRRLGDLDAVHQRALTIRETQFGADHPMWPTP